MPVTWVDLSGLGNHATQSDDAKAPMVVASVLNGYEVRRFDGSNDALVTPVSASQKPLSWFAVVKSDTGAAARDILGVSADGGSQWSIDPGSGDLIVAKANAAYVLSPANVPSALGTAWTILSFTYSNVGAAAQFKNGAAYGSVTNNQTFTAARTRRIGSSILESVEQQYWDGDMVEIIELNVDLSTANRQGVERYLSDKFGIGISHSAASVNPASLSGKTLWLAPSPFTGWGVPL